MTSHLFVGTGDATDYFLRHTKPPFLFVGCGPMFDAFAEHFLRAKHFNLQLHSFNPLRATDYLAQSAFIDVLMAAFPGGQNTLTKEGVPDVLFEALAQKPKRLDDMLLGTSDDPSYRSAQRMIRRILRSPVLTEVLCQPTNFSFKGSVIARIDPAELGEFDALLLTWLLIGQHKGQIVLYDFGRYGRPLHQTLIDQDRLLAGLRYLDEVPLPLRQALLTIEDKHFSHLLPDDAKFLIGFTDNPAGNPTNLM